MLGLWPHRAQLLVIFCLMSLGIGEALFAEALENTTEDVPTAKQGTKRKKKPAKAKAVVSTLDQEPLSRHSLARTYFRKKQYRTALLYLDDNAKDVEALWIKAESHFRLDEFVIAKPYFEAIFESSNDALEKRKASVRLFDIEIATNNVQGAIDRYVAYSKEHKKPPAQMRYALGKALYDYGYHDRATKFLLGIPKGSEFYMRSSYMVAAIGLDKRKPQASIKLFRQIENMKPVSVEDVAVLQMAILAQGRLLIDQQREDLADKAYERVSLSSEFGEEATKEIVRAWLTRAELARLGASRFSETSAVRRKLIEDQSVEAAEKAIARFRKVHEIDWHRPELLTLMAETYVAARRYEEARLAYGELTDHFRPIYNALRENEYKKDSVWPYFSLDFDLFFDKPKSEVIFGVPNSLGADVSEINQILSVRSRIIKNQQQLRKLEANFKTLPKGIDALKEVRDRQNAIRNAYERMVINKQKKITEKVAINLNQTLAEAEFERARLVVLEMQDIRTQQKAVQDFQNKKIEMFEADLKKLDEGGSP